MGTLTIRNLEEATKRELRGRAAARGVSMEQEVRERLAGSVPKRKKKATIEEILALGVKPSEPFDLKKLNDEMWDEGLS
jgi:plasmid stability protein